MFRDVPRWCSSSTRFNAWRIQKGICYRRPSLLFSTAKNEGHSCATAPHSNFSSLALTTCFFQLVLTTWQTCRMRKRQCSSPVSWAVVPPTSWSDSFVDWYPFILSSNRYYFFNFVAREAWIFNCNAISTYPSVWTLCLIFPFYLNRFCAVSGWRNYSHCGQIFITLTSLRTANWKLSGASPKVSFDHFVALM